MQSSSSMPAKSRPLARVGYIVGVILIVIAVNAWTKPHHNPMATTTRLSSVAREKLSREPNARVDDYSRCVSSMNAAFQQFGGNLPEMLRSRHLADENARVSFLSGDGVPQYLTVKEVHDEMARNADFKFRMEQLGDLATQTHKSLKLGSKMLQIFPDRTVMTANSRACRINSIFMGNGVEFHPDIVDTMKPKLSAVGDSLVSEDKVKCKNFRMDLEAEKRAEEECKEQLSNEFASGDWEQLIRDRGADEMVVSLVDSDGVIVDLAKTEALTNAVVRKRLEAVGEGMKTTRRAEMNSVTIFATPDNSVITVDTDACEVNGVYLNDDEDYHPDIQENFDTDATVQEDGKKKKKAKKKAKKQEKKEKKKAKKAAKKTTTNSGTARTISGTARSSTYANGVPKSCKNNGGYHWMTCNTKGVGLCTVRYRKAKSSACHQFQGKGKYNRCKKPLCKDLFCYQNDRPAYTCEMNGYQCYVNLFRKKMKHYEYKDAQNHGCGRFGAKRVDMPSNTADCPAEHCCYVKSCPLTTTQPSSCQRPGRMNGIYDTSSVVHDVVGYYKLGLQLLSMVGYKAPGLAKAAPEIALGALGFLGVIDDPMSPETAFKQALMYTNELIQEVHECIEEKFTQTWESVIQVSLDSIDQHLYALDKATSARDRVFQIWNNVADDCVALGNQFEQYADNYVDNYAYEYLVEAMHFMRICTGAMTQYMADCSDENVNLSPWMPYSDMRHIAYQIDRFIKLATARLYLQYAPDCGKLPVVQEKMLFLEENVLAPSHFLAVVTYGGVVEKTVVIESQSASYTGSDSRTLLNDDTRDVLCRDMCVSMDGNSKTTPSKTCYAAEFEDNKCYGYLDASWDASKVAQGSNKIYQIKSREDAAVQISRPSSITEVELASGRMQVEANAIARKQKTAASYCLEECLADTNCYASKAGSNDVCSTGLDTSVEYDYVVARGAKVVEMKNTYWDTTTTSESATRSGCVAKCVKDTTCVALDWKSGNKCHFIKSADTYPGDTALTYDKDWYHYEIFRDGDTVVGPIMPNHLDTPLDNTSS